MGNNRRIGNGHSTGSGHPLGHANSLSWCGQPMGRIHTMGICWVAQSLRRSEGLQPTFAIAAGLGTGVRKCLRRGTIHDGTLHGHLPHACRTASSCSARLAPRSCSAFVVRCLRCRRCRLRWKQRFRCAAAPEVADAPGGSQGRLAHAGVAEAVRPGARARARSVSRGAGLGSLGHVGGLCWALSGHVVGDRGFRWPILAGGRRDARARPGVLQVRDMASALQRHHIRACARSSSFSRV